jgi:hypothetical protein
MTALSVRGSGAPENTTGRRAALYFFQAIKGLINVR